MADRPTYHLWLNLQGHCAECVVYANFDAHSKDESRVWRGSSSFALHFRLPQTTSHLLACGVDVNAKIPHQSRLSILNIERTPLAEALHWREVNVIRELLAHKADVHTEDACGIRLYARDYQPAIGTAVIYNNHSSMIAALLEYGADGAKGLVIAATHKDREHLIQIFLAYGVNINVRTQVTSDANAESVTALEAACGQLYVPSVKVLLVNGADPNVRSDYDESALERVLNQYGFSLNIEWDSEFDETLKLLFKHGADVNLVRMDMLSEHGRLLYEKLSAQLKQKAALRTITSEDLINIRRQNRAVKRFENQNTEITLRPTSFNRFYQYQSQILIL
ncbi:MAG: hypothetical protein Q9191_005098 [Dirinaria sp. TL-2023a]